MNDIPSIFNSLFNVSAVSPASSAGYLRPICSDERLKLMSKPAL